MDYHRRKALGQARRAEYLRRLDHAHTLARMFYGIVLGASFVAVMGIVAGVNTFGKGLIIIFCFALIWIFTGLAGYVVIRAERSRRY